MVGAVQQSAQNWMAGGGGLFDAVFSSSNASFLRRRALAKRIKAAKAREKMNMYEKQAQVASVAAKAASIASSKIIRVKSKPPDKKPHKASDKGPAIAAARAASSRQSSTASDYTLPSSLRGHQGAPNNIPPAPVPAQPGLALPTGPMVGQPYDQRQQQQGEMHHLHGNQVPHQGNRYPQPPPVQLNHANPYAHQQNSGQIPPPPQHIEQGRVQQQHINRPYGSPHDPAYIRPLGYGPDAPSPRMAHQPPTHVAGGYQHYETPIQHRTPMHDPGRDGYPSNNNDHYVRNVQPQAGNQPPWRQDQMPSQSPYNRDHYMRAQEPQIHQNSFERPYNRVPPHEDRHLKDMSTQTDTQTSHRPERNVPVNQGKKTFNKQSRQVSFDSTTGYVSDDEASPGPSNLGHGRTNKHDGSKYSFKDERQPNKGERLEDLINTLSHMKTSVTSEASERSSKLSQDLPWTDSRDKRLVDLRCRLDYEWHEIADMLRSTVTDCVNRFVELIDEGLAKQPADSGKKWEPFEDRVLRQLRERRCTSQFSACLMGRSVKEVNDRYTGMKEHDFEQTRRRGEAENRIWGTSHEGRPNESSGSKKSVLKNNSPSQGQSGKSEGTGSSGKDNSTTAERSRLNDNKDKEKQDKQQGGKQNETAKGKNNSNKDESRSPAAPETPAQPGWESTVDDADSFYDERLRSPRRPDRYYGVNLNREGERFAKLRLLDNLVRESPKNVSYDTYWRIVADRFGAATGLWPTLRELADLADLNRREAWSEAMRLLGWIEASRRRQKLWN